MLLRLVFSCGEKPSDKTSDSHHAHPFIPKVSYCDFWHMRVKRTLVLTFLILENNFQYKKYPPPPPTPIYYHMCPLHCYRCWIHWKAVFVVHWPYHDGPFLWKIYAHFDYQFRRFTLQFYVNIQKHCGDQWKDPCVFFLTQNCRARPDLIINSQA